MMKRFFTSLLLLLVLASPTGAQYLKQSTATQVALKFVDATDGVTAELSLTVTTFDCILIKHADSGMAATGMTITASGGVNDAAHTSDGIYSLELTATDTDTLGRLVVHCQCAGAAPFEQTYTVLSSENYTQLITSSASIADFWAKLTSELTAANSVGKLLVDDKQFVASGTADSGTTTTIVDTERTEAVSDWAQHSVVVFLTGTNAGQTRQVTGFNTTTDTLTVTPALTNAVTTETYQIRPSFEFLRPTTSGRTLDVATTGEVGVDLSNVNGTLDASEIGADALTAAKFAADVSTEFATTLMATNVEAGLTFQHWFQYGGSALFGEYNSAAGTFNFRDIADTKNRLVYVTTSTARTSVTLSPD